MARRRFERSGQIKGKGWHSIGVARRVREAFSPWLMLPVLPRCICVCGIYYIHIYIYTYIYIYVYILYNLYSLYYIILIRLSHIYIQAFEDARERERHFTIYLIYVNV